MANKTSTSKAAVKASKAAKAAGHVRADWKVGTPKAADGTTGTNPCICGCGTLVKRLFAQGHDARVHSWLLQVANDEKPKSSLPATVLAALDHGVIRMPSTNHQDGRVLTPEARTQARKLAARKERKQARKAATKAQPKSTTGAKLPLSGLAAKKALAA